MSRFTGPAMLRVCAAGWRFSIFVASACVLWPMAAQAEELPAGWRRFNVGQTATATGAAGNGSTFTIIGSGADIAGTSDRFTFVYRQVSGDVDVIARLASLRSSTTSSKAGLMVRTSLSASAAHASMFARTAGSLGFRRRPASGLLTLFSDAGPGYTPVWVKLERRGTVVTAFRSADGLTWKMVGSETLSLPATFYVGLFALSGSSATATAEFTNVTVRAPGNVLNTPPTVSIWSPTDRATFTAPTIVNLAATANDADNGVAVVEFYANNKLVGTAKASPYTYAWTPRAGAYTIRAVARDNAGAAETSAPRSITVNAPDTSNTSPTVSLTAPAAGSTYIAPASVTITATAGDANGIVARVDFYAGSTLVGSDTSSPYGVTWSNAPAGSYSLTAVARDNHGATTASAPRGITIGTASTNTPPTISLSAPAAGSGYIAPASVTITANAADASGTVARVDFYAGSTLVGSDTTSPYSATWNNAPAGAFSLTAVARDNAGATTTSAARSITIANPPLPKRAIFTASPDHATVSRYSLDVFTAGANPATSLPIATQTLGKPAVVNGDCDVDVSATILGLPGGNYFATVVAISSGGTSTRAVSSTFAR